MAESIATLYVDIVPSVRGIQGQLASQLTKQPAGHPLGCGAGGPATFCLRNRCPLAGARASIKGAHLIILDIIQVPLVVADLEEVGKKQARH